jgi:5-oxoprolinase (ATP-hydrolysing) subunit A
VLAGRAAEVGLTVVGEGFADRGYLPDGRLAPRSRPDALVHDPDEVVARVVRMAADNTVVAVDGSVVTCRVRSICLHGDTPGAVGLARSVRDGLRAAGQEIRPFTAGQGR